MKCLMPTYYSLQLSPQPGAGHFPIALDCSMPDAHDFSGLFDGKPAKETQLNDAFLLWIERCQLFQRFVKCQQIDRRLFDKLFRAGDRESLLIRTAPFCGLMLTCVVDKDTAH